jgi:hypothetical protein
MARKYVFLDYTFIFDPTDSWQHVSQFESDLSDFLGAYGFEAQIVNAIGGQPGKRMLLVRRIDRLINATKSNPGQQKNMVQPMKKILDPLRQSSMDEKAKKFKSQRMK